MPVWLFLIVGLLGGLLIFWTAPRLMRSRILARRIIGLVWIAVFLECAYIYWRDR